MALGPPPLTLSRTHGGLLTRCAQASRASCRGRSHTRQPGLSLCLRPLPCARMRACRRARVCVRARQVLLLLDRQVHELDTAARIALDKLLRRLTGKHLERVRQLKNRMAFSQKKASRPRPPPGQSCHGRA